MTRAREHSTGGHATVSTDIFDRHCDRIRAGRRRRLLGLSRDRLLSIVSMNAQSPTALPDEIVIRFT
jgi:hypothetical protein